MTKNKEILDKAIRHAHYLGGFLQQFKEWESPVTNAADLQQVARDKLERIEQLLLELRDSER